MSQNPNPVPEDLKEKLRKEMIEEQERKAMKKMLKTIAKRLKDLSSATSRISNLESKIEQLSSNVSKINELDNEVKSMKQSVTTVSELKQALSQLLEKSKELDETRKELEELKRKVNHKHTWVEVKDGLLQCKDCGETVTIPPSYTKIRSTEDVISYMFKPHVHGDKKYDSILDCPECRTNFINELKRHGYEVSTTGDILRLKIKKK